MRTSSKNRRSERTPATQRLVLTILGPGGAEVLKEIITTAEISRHGARIRGRRTLKPDWRGAFVQLTSGRKVAVRVVWQTNPAPNEEFKESGVEIIANFNFWGRVFSSPDQEPDSFEIKNAAVCLEEACQYLRAAPEFRNGTIEKLMEAVWWVMFEKLEGQKDCTRQELAESLRSVSQRVTRPVVPIRPPVSEMIPLSANSA